MDNERIKEYFNKMKANYDFLWNRLSLNYIATPFKADYFVDASKENFPYPEVIDELFLKFTNEDNISALKIMNNEDEGYYVFRISNDNLKTTLNNNAEEYIKNVDEEMGKRK